MHAPAPLLHVGAGHGHLLLAFCDATTGESLKGGFSEVLRRDRREGSREGAAVEDKSARRMTGARMRVGLGAIRTATYLRPRSSLHSGEYRINHASES